MRPLLTTSFVLGVLLLPLPAMAQTTDPAAVVQRFVAALNAKDMASALCCFSDDAAYGGGAGKEYIRSRLERDFSVNRRLVITAIQVVGNRVIWSWQSFEDPYQRLTVPPIEGTDESLVENGVIVSNTGAVDQDSVRRQQAALPVALATRRAQLAIEATQAAHATQVAASGLLQRLPSTQERGTPPAVPWAAAVVLLLFASVGLAAFRRPESSL